MKKLRLPFRYEFTAVLALCLFVMMCTEGPNDEIQVSIRNMCSDNFKLCETCDHVKPGQTAPDYLTLELSAPEGTFTLWRKNLPLGEFTVTGVIFPSEDSTRPYKETIVVKSTINDPADPFDDEFTAEPWKDYVTVTKVY